MVNPQSLVGKQIEQFRVDQFIARGSMGMVFKAFDTVLARTVALKLIAGTMEQDHLSLEETALREEARKRLIQEAKAAGRLTHPNIVTVHSYGETDEFQYICMEYVPGKTLAQVLAEKKVLDVQEATVIFDQILQALDAANGEHIVHRDIKPSNIMMTPDERVKVMDFGIAKLPTFSMTVTGTVLGTPYYMSPEQIAGQKVDIRSDIFSVGAVFYQALTGERPFEAQNTAALTYQIINTEPIPPVVRNATIPGRVSDIVQKAMAKDRTQRYQTPAEMLRDLRGTKEAVQGAKRLQDDQTVLAKGIASDQMGLAQGTTERTPPVQSQDMGTGPSHKAKAEPVEPERTEPEKEKPLRAERPIEAEEMPPSELVEERRLETGEVSSVRGADTSKIAAAAVVFFLVGGIALALLYRQWSPPQPGASSPGAQHQKGVVQPTPGDHPPQSSVPPTTQSQTQTSQWPGTAPSLQQEPSPPQQQQTGQHSPGTSMQPAGDPLLSPPKSVTPPGATSTAVSTPSSPPPPAFAEPLVASEKAQTAAVVPPKQGSKVDRPPERTATLRREPPKETTKAPPSPRRPKITSFTEAKLAYSGHKITAEEYRTLVRDLKIAYNNEVEQLKVDYRSGKIGKVEYSRRASDIKAKYR